MTDTKPTPIKWLTGRAVPPLWFRLIVAVGFFALAGAMWVKRGAVVGIIAVLAYGFIALYGLLGFPATAWSKRHPLLDNLLMVPLLFLAVAYLTNLSTGMCMLIAALASAPLIGLSAVRRRRRISRT